MISVDEALNLVLQRARPRAPADVDLDQSLARILADDVASDVDSPPYDKAMVDGYAVVSEDILGGRTEMRVLEEVVAGGVPSQPVQSGTATRIMTGAPIPDGADAVIMVEETETLADSADHARVAINAGRFTPGQNILRQGVAMRHGEVVLSAGSQIRPSDVGLLAEVGRQRVSVVPRPTMAIISTGNELVPPGQSPGPGQIRNSNGPMLTALAESAGATPVNLGIGRDEHDELRRLIEQGLQCDVLALSGGVSAGVLDLVPGVLAELGVEKVFHKVQLKPGKPLWFGVKPHAQSADTLVFGLPGNPVSSFACFELFVRPTLRRLAGVEEVKPQPRRAELTSDFAHKGNRPTYHPAMLREENGRWLATPSPWQGSADLRAFAAANALIHFPAGDRMFAVGEELDVYPLE